MRSWRWLTAAAVCVLVFGACSSDDKNETSSDDAVSTTAAGAAAAAGSIDVADQSSDGTQLVIKSVTITNAPNGGWIALHNDQNGQPGPVMGKVHVGPGTSTNVVAKFDSKQASAKFWPMLHVDAGSANVYEFPGADVPVKDGSEVVMKQITLTVS